MAFAARMAGIAAGIALVASLFCVGPAHATERAAGGASAPLALRAMLRADLDKDGVLSREELEQFSLILAPRFGEVDADKDGRLSLHELEKLLGTPQTAAGGR